MNKKLNTDEEMISTSSQKQDDGFEVLKAFPSNEDFGMKQSKLIATDGEGAEDESENSFEFDVQPDDIYDLTVF